MSEKPILFSTDMVRALISAQKTQTRRVVKPQPVIHDSGSFQWEGRAPGSFVGMSGTDIEGFTDPVMGASFYCPYGKTGDDLWVREAWAPNEGSAGGFLYRADYGDGANPFIRYNLKTGGEPTHYAPKWKPSIHMPRAASRLTLEIVKTRVERLNDISDLDAFSEGIRSVPHIPSDGTARGTYKALWEQINGVGSWSKNPWVWVVEFIPRIKR